MEENKITEYKFKIRKGIDDLKSLYAFHGNSQGDETKSNCIEDYISSKGWLSFSFDCALTNEAIAEEIKKREQWNYDYIKELLKSVEYGSEVEHTLSMNFNPELDTQYEQSYPLESYSFLIFDTDNKK